MRRARGSVYKLAPGRYRVQVSRGTADGKRSRRSATVTGTRRDAEQTLERMLTHDGFAPRGLTVDRYLRDQWLPAQKIRTRPRTWQGYEDQIRRYITPTLGGVALDRLTPILVDTWLDGLRAGNLSERTRHHAFAVLRAACRQAVKWRLLDRDPTDAVQAPKPRRFEPRPLDAAQASAMLACLLPDPAIGAAVALGVGAGMRRSEIGGLRWSRVELDAGIVQIVDTLQVPRGGVETAPTKSAASQRRVHLPAWTVAALRDHRRRQLAAGTFRSDGYVVTNRRGGPLHPSELSRQFRAALEKAGLPACRFHDLRHTHATLLHAAGVDLKLVQVRLGHSTLSVTADTYTHPSTASDEAMARILDRLAP